MEDQDEVIMPEVDPAAAAEVAELEHVDVEAAIAAAKAEASAEPPAPPAPAAAPPAPAVPAAAPAAPALDVSAFIREQAQARSELEAAKAEVRTAKAAAETHARELARLQDTLKSNPLEAAKAHGWDLESIQRGVMQGATPEGVRVARLEAELQSLRAAQQARDTEAATAREAAEATRSIEAFKDTAMAQFQAVADQYPLTSKFLETAELRDSLYDVMAREYQSKGSRLTPAQAAAQLEAQLTARVKRLQVTTTSTVPPAKPATKTPTLTNDDKAVGIADETLEDLDLSPVQLAQKAEKAFAQARAQAAAGV